MNESMTILIIFGILTSPVWGALLLGIMIILLIYVGILLELIHIMLMSVIDTIFKPYKRHTKKTKETV